MCAVCSMEHGVLFTVCWLPCAGWCALDGANICSGGKVAFVLLVRLLSEPPTLGPRGVSFCGRCAAISR